jgi:NAD(P)-dependent dehydrogenase (short-subunit alcohol dehydrogenase family)
VLEDRVVLVTGAGRGIGRGIAQAVIGKGAAVIITDITENSAKETEALIKEENSEAQTLAMAMDITQEEMVEKTMAASVEKFGRIDGLVNNAAVMMDSGPLLDSDLQKRTKEIDVNINGIFNCSKAFVAQVRKQNTPAAIVNVASHGGVRAHVFMGHYSGTKAAVLNLTQCQSAEWAQYGVNVNAVCPGGVHTEMLQAAAEAKSVGNEKRSATELRETWLPPQLGRKMEAIEVGYVVAFLLSEQAVLVRGQSISVAGGIEHEAIQDYLG